MEVLYKDTNAIVARTGSLANARTWVAEETQKLNRQLANLEKMGDLLEKAALLEEAAIIKTEDGAHQTIENDPLSTLGQLQQHLYAMKTPRAGTSASASPRPSPASDRGRSYSPFVSTPSGYPKSSMAQSSGRSSQGSAKTTGTPELHAESDLEHSESDEDSDSPQTPLPVAEKGVGRPSKTRIDADRTKWVSFS